MIEKIFDYVKRYGMLEAGDTVIAGVSGGADSVCLLFVLLALREKIPFSLAAAHINHGIRREAGEDAEYVRQLCRKCGIPFYLKEADMRKEAKRQGLSEEEAGRKIRYEAFREALRRENQAKEGLRKEIPEKEASGNGGALFKTGKIAVAHNANDRAETMLFHLFRGTGLSGAAGIKPVNGNIIRPLLCVSRKEIEAYLQEKGIPYREDSTNSQDIYTRNRIRHHILPYAEAEICPGAVENLCRAGELLEGAGAFVEREVQKAGQRCLLQAPEDRRAAEQRETGSGRKRQGEPSCRLSLPRFLEEDEYLQGSLLLACIEELTGSRKDITRAHLDSIRRLFAGKGNGEVHLPGGLKACKKYETGVLCRNIPYKDRVGTKEPGALGGQDEGLEGKREYAVPLPGNLEIPGLGRVEFTIFSYEKSKNIPQKTYTKWFDYDKISTALLFRVRKQGDYLTINERKDRKSLQDYFVNEKVPREERDCFYVLAEGSHIMWVPGYRISAHYKVSEATKTVLQVKIPQREE